MYQRDSRPWGSPPARTVNGPKQWTDPPMCPSASCHFPARTGTEEGGSCSKENKSHGPAWHCPGGSTTCWGLWAGPVWRGSGILAALTWHPLLFLSNTPAVFYFTGPGLAPALHSDLGNTPGLLCPSDICHFLFLPSECPPGPAPASQQVSRGLGWGQPTGAPTPQSPVSDMLGKRMGINPELGAVSSQWSL